MHAYTWVLWCLIRCCFYKHACTLPVPMCFLTLPVSMQNVFPHMGDRSQGWEVHLSQSAPNERKWCCPLGLGGVGLVYGCVSAVHCRGHVSMQILIYLLCKAAKRPREKISPSVAVSRRCRKVRGWETSRELEEGPSDGISITQTKQIRCSLKDGERHFGSDMSVLSEHVMGAGTGVHTKFLRGLFSQQLPAAAG